MCRELKNCLGFLRHAKMQIGGCTRFTDSLGAQLDLKIRFTHGYLLAVGSWFHRKMLLKFAFRTFQQTFS